MTTATNTFNTQATSTIIFLERDSQEWDRAWREIERRYGDTACECPVTGEVWQYMGTVARPGGYEHQFRHRHLPARDARIYDSVIASCAWRPDDR